MSWATDICPMCGGSIVPTTLECPHCGERRVSGGGLSTDVNELREEHETLTADRRKYNQLGFAFGLPGLAMQAVGRVLLETEQITPLVGVTVQLGGAILFAIGIYYVARYRGQHGAWALASLFGCIGLVVLLVVKDFNKARLTEIETALREVGQPIV